MKNKPVRFLAIVSHSLGEFDVLFPFFARLKSQQSVEVKIIVAVKKIYDQYQSSPFLQYCGQSLKIDVRHFKIPNKFDSLGRTSLLLSKTRLGRKILHLWVRGAGLFRAPVLFRSLISSDYYMHEVSNQIQTTRILYVFNFLLKKPILTYHHGPGVVKTTAVTKPIKHANLTTHLSFHEHNRETLSKLGFISQIEIGYPQFFPEWQQLVSKFVELKGEVNKSIVIFTRHVSQAYLDQNDYDYLLKTSFEVIREKYGDILIVVKPHPRQDTLLLRKTLRSLGFGNFEVSAEHAAALSKNANLVIAFFGSTILHSLSVGAPAIEYNIEAKNFRKSEFEGSPYKNLGIHSAECKNELREFFEEVLQARYVRPEIVEDLARKRRFAIGRFNNFVVEK